MSPDEQLRDKVLNSVCKQFLGIIKAAPFSRNY
jgi:hypothetical protein